MTEPTLPTYEVLGNGIHLFTVPPGDIQLEITVLQHRPGYLLTETVAKLGQDRVVNHGTIDLLNLQDRERFHRGAAAVDGVVNWDHWLRFALEHVRMSLAVSPLPDKEHQGRSCLAVDLSPALVSFHDMLQLTLPERARYLPWLPERGLAMVYGPRGVGKTQFMLGLATHLATGQTFLRWEVSQSIGVLYIDGEMPLDELRQRAVLLAEQTSPTSLVFLTGEMVYTRLGYDLVLTEDAIRDAIGRMLDAHPEIRVVILDNISCLFSGISEDRKQDWEPNREESSRKSILISP